MPDFMESRPQCEVTGCENPSINATTRLCPGHWHRVYRHGDVHATHDDVGRVSGYGLFGAVSRGEDWVLCHECGKTFKTLGAHLRGAHDMSADEYRAEHGLASNDALMCDQMRRKIGTEATERIGTEGWQKFAARRDATVGESHKLAAAATKRAGARASHAANAKRNAPTAREWACAVCGKPVLPGRGTCSKECADSLKRTANGKRDALRKGESQDFTHRQGSGAKLTKGDVMGRMMLTNEALRTRIRRGQFPDYAGRVGWVAFWWESDLPSR